MCINSIQRNMGDKIRDLCSYYRDGQARTHVSVNRGMKETSTLNYNFNCQTAADNKKPRHLVWVLVSICKLESLHHKNPCTIKPVEWLIACFRDRFWSFNFCILHIFIYNTFFRFFKSDKNIFKFFLKQVCLQSYIVWQDHESKNMHS
jgi:hypothetical protein